MKNRRILNLAVVIEANDLSFRMGFDFGLWYFNFWMGEE